VKIYTRTGDAGGTALFGGERVQKSAPRVGAYGAVDEANAHVGLASACPELPADIRAELVRVMSDLFDVGAELATPQAAGEKLAKLLPNRVEPARTEELERAIDRAETELAPLTTFILPTGTDAAARLHVARTVVRRAEREIVALGALPGESVRPELIAYVNRLSDALFVWARLANARARVADTPWAKR
jgi:cob(I)alamin adenosyltransferase